MNPSSSSSYWNNPPPPGTEFDIPDDDIDDTSQKNESTRSDRKSVDRTEPPIKNPTHRGQEGECSSERIRYKSRSHSPHHHKRRKRSRSRSRDRHKHAHSRRRRRRFSSSRSRSRSPSYRHRRKRRTKHYSRSRSKSRSRSYSVSRSYRSDRDGKYSRSPRIKNDHRSSDKRMYGDILKPEDMQLEEEEEEEGSPEPTPVPFKNDGSFLEMFKKMQEEKIKEEPAEEDGPKKPALPVFGKRRGGKVLKTGMVQKVRNIEEEDTTKAQDAWSVYMKEVKKYKEACCTDDSKTRPLLK